jgi:competence protein ComFC
VAVVKFKPIRIEGHWRHGVALDLHTISSAPIGYSEAGRMQHDTARTPL